jgi:hypothetical protein
MPSTEGILQQIYNLFLNGGAKTQITDGTNVIGTSTYPLPISGTINANTINSALVDSITEFKGEYPILTADLSRGASVANGANEITTFYVPPDYILQPVALTAVVAIPPSGTTGSHQFEFYTSDMSPDSGILINAAYNVPINYQYKTPTVGGALLKQYPSDINTFNTSLLGLMPQGGQSFNIRYTNNSGASQTNTRTVKLYYRLIPMIGLTIPSPITTSPPVNKLLANVASCGNVTKDITGFSGYTTDETITYDTTVSYGSNAGSIKCVCPGNYAHEGVQFIVQNLISGTPNSIDLQVKVPNGVVMQIFPSWTGAPANATFTGTGAIQEVKMENVNVGQNGIGNYLIRTNTQIATTFNIAQIMVNDGITAKPFSMGIG